MLILEILFFICLLILIYVYSGYPLIIFLVAKLRNKKVKKADYYPYVTVLIAAFNEENSIEATLNNKLKLNYPKDKLEVIVVSDDSTDMTNDIVSRFKPLGIQLIVQKPRSGKSAALNMAYPMVKGEFIIFSDANSIFESDAISKLVRNFNDPQVGYVTGKMIYVNPKGSLVGDGCSSYMKYENFIRAQETLTGSIVGVDGGIDAIRAELYERMNPDQLPDFILPLKVAEKGYRIVYEPEAVLQEAALSYQKDEYRMRLRVILRAFWALKDMYHLLSLKKYRFFAFQLWSHKLLRYFCFIFLSFLYITNLTLLQLNSFFVIFFILQNLFLFLSLVPFVIPKGISEIKLFRYLNYFLLLNVAAAHAFFNFVSGKKQIVWNPRKGN